MLDENNFEINTENTEANESEPHTLPHDGADAPAEEIYENVSSDTHTAEEAACSTDSTAKKSEFERELENYLPTPENTDKIKKPMPQWAISVIASVVTCMVMFLVYSIAVVPKLRPSAVISYVESQPNEVLPATSESNISGINAKVSQSIVSIETKASYRNFFGISSSTNTGSGVVLSSDGYVLTSSSLVGNDGETSVILPDKQKYEARLVGADENKDIAILKIDASNLVFATLANSDTVNAGDTAIVIGNVLGGNLGTSITKGIICGVNNGVSLQNGSTINLLQTDAITNSNNAGGCLLNTNGDVIGMITYAISANVENISFAIPSNDIKNVAESLINTGTAPEALIIGITGSDSDHGVLVETVMENTPAERAGIKANDLILKVNDTAVKSISEINKIRDSHKKGDTLKITVYRDGETIDINVTL
ncbi:MAG: trypsin-like peptidase domain-containing protein [Clostridia bacterium]|nr:trypsin-like peptidase domain-containing protein [Clostridia bacterium]